MEGRKVVAWIKQKESEGLTKGDILTMREMYEEEVGASMSQATWRRRIREVFSNGDLTIEDLPKVLQKIGERFSPEELRAIAQGESADAMRFGTPTVVSREGTTLKFGFVTDLHIGSKYFHPNKLRAAYDMFRSEGVTDILISGDITAGMSNRDGHVFECTHLGYAAQRDYAEELLREWQGEIYAIDGNHDRWYGKRSGAKIVPDLERLLPNLSFLGHDEGDLLIDTPEGQCWIKLWHGEDGSSYATSYRIQKLVESLTGGQKPHILLCGHVHKQGNFMERNIHTVSGGCIQNKSKWMRGKRLPAHVGFWIIEFTMTKDGVTRFKPEWFPFFETHPDESRDSDSGLQ
jgi:predicted phosphodiesterase